MFRNQHAGELESNVIVASFLVISFILHVNICELLIFVYTIEYLYLRCG